MVDNGVCYVGDEVVNLDNGDSAAFFSYCWTTETMFRLDISLDVADNDFAEDFYLFKFDNNDGFRVRAVRSVGYTDLLLRHSYVQNGHICQLFCVFVVVNVAHGWHTVYHYATNCRGLRYWTRIG